MAVTEGERALEALVRPSFLTPWMYPNLYYKKGKELADIIVRFGDVAIIISEKSKKFNYESSIEHVWGRWLKNIGKAQDQIDGAERMLRKGQALYLDAKCTNPAPSFLTDHEPNDVYRIVVAQGCAEACSSLFGTEEPGLIIHSEVNGSAPVLPFSYNPWKDEKIYHVLNEYSANVVFSLIDTTRDLVDYLHEKERLLRSVESFSAHGEEQLVRHYVTNIDADGNHSFDALIKLIEDDKPNFVMYDEEDYTSFQNSSELEQKRILDVPSYIVDKFVNHFYPRIEGCADKEGEEALRILAELRRIERRMLGKSFYVFRTSEHGNGIAARTIVVGGSLKEADTAIILTSYGLPFDNNDEGRAKAQDIAADIQMFYAHRMHKVAPNISRYVAVGFIKSTADKSANIGEFISLVRTDQIREEDFDDLQELATRLGVSTSLPDVQPYHTSEYGENDDDSATAASDFPTIPT